MPSAFGTGKPPGAFAQDEDPYRLNEVPVDRGFLAPLATYADGKTELAMPGLPLGMIWDGLRSFGAKGFDTPEANELNVKAANDAAGGAMTGSFAYGLAGGMADNALGSAGAKLTGNALERSASDLPMDLASRMARAKEMGFDTDKTWYHGSTHDFMEFDPARGNPEGHLGAGSYFTNSPKDAWKNYGPDGPDLTNRVEQIAERIYSDAGNVTMDAARQQARQQIAGQSDGAIYPVMLRGKTLDLRGSTRGNPTALEMQYGPSPDEFMDVARKELGDTADKWDLYDRARELADEASADATPTGELWDFVESIRRQSGEYGFDADEVLARLDEAMADGVGAADDIDRKLRNSPLMYAEHPETGALVGNDVIRQAFNDAGYPNIVMDAKAAFPSMPNIDPGTLHMIVSDPRNIRSVNAAFDPAKSDSANLLAANAKSGAAVPLAIDAAESQAPQGIRAYHGSPHDFDRFSLDKIGTGEGAQAYGHGLYFADSEDVARGYRDKLDQTYVDIPDASRGEAMAVTQARNEVGNDKQNIINELNRLGDLWKDSDADMAARYYGARDKMANATIQNPSRMYEVNIKANPEDFLDWDKPLSQQPETVRTVLERMGWFGSDTMPEGYYGDTAAAIIGGNRAGGGADRYAGADIYAAMNEGTGTVSTSQALREAGIPGIKYLDGMSRDGGTGTSNYVVFDDQMVDILRKYSNAPTGAAIPLGMEGQEQDPFSYFRREGD